MNNQTAVRSRRIRMMCTVAMFMAIELAMWLMGLGQVPFGPLNMSFLTVPVAIGAMLLGPLPGTILGATFGFTSFWDAMTGRSVLTGFFFFFFFFRTFLLCVGMRVLMGFATGLIFRAVRKIDRRGIICWLVGGLSAPLLNTCFFMGFIVTVFYQTEMVQNLVARTGATNPFMFIVLLVGVQGLVEAVVCTVVAGAAAKGVAKAMKL